MTSSSHLKLTCSRHDISEKLLSCHKTTYHISHMFVKLRDFLWRINSCIIYWYNKIIISLLNFLELLAHCCKQIDINCMSLFQVLTLTGINIRFWINKIKMIIVFLSKFWTLYFVLKKYQVFIQGVWCFQDKIWFDYYDTLYLDGLRKFCRIFTRDSLDTYHTYSYKMHHGVT